MHNPWEFIRNFEGQGASKAKGKIPRGTRGGSNNLHSQCLHCTLISKLCFVIGVDADKNPIDSTSVVSPDSKVEGVNGEIPTENGNNNVTEDDVSKVSCL